MTYPHATLQHWQREDGYDPRDPDAPAVFCCECCDAYRPVERMYCGDCGEVTGSYLWRGTSLGERATRSFFAQAYCTPRREAHTGLINFGEDTPTASGLRVVGGMA